MPAKLTVVDDFFIRPYALSAASALFKYLESERIAFPNGSLRISYHPLEGTCLIDHDTINYLELVTNVGPTHPVDYAWIF